jgi:predicted acylesterase/phospholipase RssA
MSVAAGAHQRTVRVERSSRPDLVTGTPSTAGNSRVDDASYGRHTDAAVLDWNNAITKTKPAPGETVIDQASSRRTTLPPDISQVVLVLQGGGALGAYQIGVYQALHDAGIEPDWVIDTSIGQ